MDPILERPDNLITQLYEFGDNILYSTADYFGITYYDLCTYLFVYLYLFIVVLLLIIIIFQVRYIRKHSGKRKRSEITE